MTRPSPCPPTGPAPRGARERGIALLLVLILMLILVPFIVEFSIQVGLESRTAQNVVDQLALENAIDGQFEIVLARLEQDAGEDEVDSLYDTWAADELKERREEETDVALSTRVGDEQGKINVLMLARAPADRRQIWKDRMVRLLVECRRDTKGAIDEGLAKELVDDAANFLGGNKARGNIPKPATPDDRGLLLLEDLAFANPKWRDLLVDARDGEDVSPGLQRYLTVYGTGKVNLNTADVAVLKAFFPTDPSIADKLIDRRQGSESTDAKSDPKTGTGTDTTGTGTGTTGTGTGAKSQDDEAKQDGNPFTDVNQVTQVEGVEAQALQKDKVDLAADFDVKSNFFGIRILAESKSTRRDELYVVERVRGQAQGAQQPASLEGFRHHLHQERTDALEDIASSE